MKFEILGVFVNTLTADDKYPVRDCENLAFLIQTPLSEKEKTFSQFFVRFLEVSASFKDFEKNMIVIANVVPILRTVKTWLDHSLKSRVSDLPLIVNMLECPKPL